MEKYFVTVTAMPKTDLAKTFTPRNRIAIIGFTDALEYCRQMRDTFGAQNIHYFIEHS